MRASGAVIERKEKPDGTVREYRCELVWIDRGVAVVRYTPPEGWEASRLPVTIPAGSVSWGYFWARRPYNAYRFTGPDGGAIAHRFDALAGLRLARDTISYRDLALDWWVTAGGALIEEDRDELEAALAGGLMTAADGARAEEAARMVTSRYRHIIDEIATLERRVLGA